MAASERITGSIILSPGDICQAIREYVGFHKLIPASSNLDMVDLNGDGKTTARVTFQIIRRTPTE